MLIDKVTIEECCICRACSNICPVGAIQFKVKRNGCTYPLIDGEKCIDCKLCENVCPALREVKTEKKSFTKCYAIKNADFNIRKNSTSGGVFFALAKTVIEHGGFVCGAVFTENFQVKHILTNQIREIREMCGSKYVQSNTEHVFVEIRNLLKEKKKVLFSGCPCQIAGLKTFLREIPDELILVEVVCHGIPGEEIFQQYLTILSKRVGSKIISFRFRDKTLGWHRSAVKIEFENGKKYLKQITDDAYMKGFLSGITLKESCYSCKYKEGKSGSDLTLGDFWGAEVEMPEVDDNMGISAVLVNTEKGDELLEELICEKREIDYHKIVKYNRNIIEATNKNPRREEFFDKVKMDGYEKAILSMLWEKPQEKLARQLRFGIRCLWYKINGRGKPLY